MRKARVAEWILSQFVAGEPASSLIGDWIEEVRTRGSFWFWSNVLRTSGALIWRDISSAPMFVAGLALRAWLFVLFLAATAGVGFFFIASAVSAGAAAGGHYLPEWTFAVMATPVFLPIPFQVGRWIGKRAGRRIVAVCLAFEFFQIVTGVVLSAIVHRFIPGQITWAPDVGTFFYTAAELVLVLTGAIRIQDRTLTKSKVI